MTNADTNAKIIERLTRKSESAESSVRRTLTKLEEGIDESPARLTYELQWAESLFEAAAYAETIDVAVEVLQVRNLDETIELFTERLVSRAGVGQSFSTSQSSNLLNVYRVKAIAFVLDELRNVKRYENS